MKITVYFLILQFTVYKMFYLYYNHYYIVVNIKKLTEGIENDD